MRPSVIFALFFVLPLTACNSGRIDLECPVVSVLGEAATMTKFRAEAGYDMTDVVYEAQMAYPEASSCDADERSVEADIAATIRVRRGAASDGGEIGVPYFIAVIGPDSAVISKQTYMKRVSFADSASIEVEIDMGEVKFPLATDRKAYHYEVVVGFQLAADELQYNRQRRHLGS